MSKRYGILGNGIGVLYDRYDEESYPNYFPRRARRRRGCTLPTKEDEWESLCSKVRTYNIYEKENTV